MTTQTDPRVEKILKKPAPLSFRYDVEADVLTIEGVKYAGSLYRALASGLATNDVFAITSRGPGGVVDVQRLGPDDVHVVETEVAGMKTKRLEVKP